MEKAIKVEMIISRAFYVWFEESIDGFLQGHSSTNIIES